MQEPEQQAEQEQPQVAAVEPAVAAAKKAVSLLPWRRTLANMQPVA